VGTYVKSKFYSTYPTYSLVEHLVAAVLIVFPALYFAVRGGMNAALFLISIISLVSICTFQKTKTNRQGFEDSGLIFAVAMASGVGVTLISQIYHQDLNGRYFDSAARFLLAIPVFLFLRDQKMRTLSTIQYAFPIGAIAAFMVVMIPNPTLRHHASTPYLNHIHLGDVSLLLGFLSVICIDWIQKDKPFVRALKLLGFAAGCSMSILSSARGGWIAIPIFAAVYLYFKFKAGLIKLLGLSVVIFSIIGLIGFFFVEPIRERLWMVYSDLSEFDHGNVDTSIGIRLQLWKAAFHLIIENPILGVGAEGFARAMGAMSSSGFITQAAADYGKGEVHNEVLAQTVRFGLFGFISILSIYFVPFYLFIRASRSENQQQVGAAMMGICVTLGFFVFGLTVETFDLKMTAAFYSLTVAALLAIATHHGSQGI
jgi:O-antigen ligase